MRKLFSIAMLCSIVASPAYAVPMGPATWRNESASGQFCILGSFNNTTLDVFGTPVNLSSVGDVLCIGTVAPPLVTAHCEAVAGASILSYDVSGPTTGAPAVVGEPLSFVVSVTNTSGSALSGLTGLTYTADGSQILRATGEMATTIAGCPIVGPVAVLDGVGTYNAFQSVATGTGTSVPVSTTVTFSDTDGEVPREVAIDLTFGEVTTGGSTLITATSNVAGTLSSNLAVDVGGYEATYFDITTTATFTGPVSICTHYDDDDNDGFIDGTGVDESALRLLHGEGGPPVTFFDRTSSQDTVNNIICAEVTSLSPFVVAVDITDQTSHDAVTLSSAPIKITIADGKTEVLKNVKIKVRNADLGEPTGHTTALSISDSTCPEAVLEDTIGNPVIPDFDSDSLVTSNSAVVASGKTSAATIPLRIRATDFATPNALSPIRCTITVVATTVDVGTVVDPNPSNNTVRLDVLVLDKNDF